MSAAAAVRIDRRFSDVRRVLAEGAAQMNRYFLARYSWGQGCDPMRARDWGTLCAYLMTCYKTGAPLELSRPFRWPSGNVGTVSGMVGIYHDGAELLDDLGILPEAWRAD